MSARFQDFTIAWFHDCTHSIQLGNIETIGFNRRTIETIGSNRFNSFQYRELTTEKLSKSVIVKNVKHGRHRFWFFFAQNGFST